MPTPPVVEQNVQSRALPAGGYNSSLSPTRLTVPQIDESGVSQRAQKGFADSLINAGGTLANIALDGKRRGDQIALIDAQRQLDDWEAKNLYDANNGALAKKGRDAFDTPTVYTSSYDKFVTDYSKGMANDLQREKFTAMANSRRATIERTLQGHERQQMDGYAKEQTSAAVESGVNRATLYHNQPAIVESSIRSAQDVVEAYGRMNGLPPEMIENQKQEISSKARLGVLTRMADENPQAAMEFYKSNVSNFQAGELLQAQKMMVPVERKYKATGIAQNVLGSAVPVLSKEQAITYVMTDLEGGDKTVADGGGIAKFGINSVANPDVDVANLDEAGAKKIYEAKYWNEIGADKLPADMRLVAFDTAVNHGVGKAKELIAASNGDVRQLLELRSKEYERLATTNPEKYGAQLEGWKNRLTKLTGQVDSMRGTLPSEFELGKRIDGMTNDLDVAADAKKLVSATLKSIEDDRKQRYESANNEAWDYVQQGRAVPASVESRMSQKDVQAMRNAEPDPIVYEQLRAQVLAGDDVNLGEYRWQLGGKFSELLKIQQDPSQQANARKVDDVIKNATGMLLGKTAPKTEGDFRKVEEFRRAVQQEVDSYQKSSGKPAGPEVLEKITDRLLLETESGGWMSGKTRLYQPPQEGTDVTITGIPRDKVYYVKGQQIGYTDLVKNLTQYLEYKKIPVNNDTLETQYKLLVEKGNLVVKRSE